MDPSSVLLEAVEIHGFRTLADLDITKLREDASIRWFRANEIHAVLTNSIHFTVQPQPVEYPTNGTFVLFDRKILRNFRRDGYKWKKKKDGKTVQEAHEKLKIGNEDRIHVYYARGEDDPNFCRRCYWLLDKRLEHIVLVHYRQTLEQDSVAQNVLALVEYKDTWNVARELYDSSPLTQVDSTSGSGQSDFSGSAFVSEEINSIEGHAIYTDSRVLLPKAHARLQINELSQLELDNLDWADLAFASENSEPCMDREDRALVSGDVMQYNSCTSGHNRLESKPMIVGEPFLDDDIFDCRRNSFVQWDNSSVAMVQSSSHQQIFTINDVSPEWGYSTEETKVVVIGNFCESHKFLEGSSIYCVFGKLCVGTQMVQPGVYRCTALPQIPGPVSLFLSFDGHIPISQLTTFQYCKVPALQLNAPVTSMDDKEKTKPEVIMTQKRLARLLFSTSGSFLSGKLLPKAIKEAKRFAQLTSASIENKWEELLKSGYKNEVPSDQACEDLFELIFRTKLQEWLMEKIAQGCNTTSRDSQGQGAIHLCTILNYTWAVSLFSSSGFSLDFRDSHGWTALHWAAHLGRVEMAATLLSAGANPSLVTDPSPENPGGLTPADLASEGGHDGLAGYLAEKGLATHFEAMSLSGNIPSESNWDVLKGQVMPEEDLYSEMTALTDQELCLKESLAAYRNAADAAVRIQAAFRERTLKLQTEAAQLDKTEVEASQIISALRIQHAYRSHSRRKLMKAAARIQSHFRTMRARKEYLNMRRQAIRIQAVFRGHQMRRQYRKVIWSVGVLEKAVLRWRLKRKGLRGMQVESMEVCKGDLLLEEGLASAEEDFFKMSRKQAEERVQRSVVRVQAMFRSYRAQQEYIRMKLAHEQAKVEFSSSEAAGLH